MTDEPQKIAESIRSGRYFSEARAWYQAVYIGPISERAFFMVIAGMASILVLFAVISLVRLMPLTHRPPIVISAGDRPDDVVHALVKLRSSGETPADAVEKLFVFKYVMLREAYSADSFAQNAAFVRAQSDQSTYNSYYAQQDASNPQSPAVLLGADGKAVVTIQSLDIQRKKSGQDEDVGAAVVSFTRETQGGETPAATTRWTATLEYRYTKLAVTEKSDPLAGVSDMTITEPQFQVIRYAVEQK